MHPYLTVLNHVKNFWIADQFESSLLEIFISQKACACVFQIVNLSAKYKVVFWFTMKTGKVRMHLVSIWHWIEHGETLP